MGEIPAEVMSTAYIKGGGLAAALLAFAMYLPKFLNNFRADKIEGNVLVRLSEAEQKIIQLSNAIHAHAIDLTLAQTLLLKVYHSMQDNGHDIPEELAEYIDEMMAERKKAKESKRGTQT